MREADIVRHEVTANKGKYMAVRVRAWGVCVIVLAQGVVSLCLVIVISQISHFILASPNRSAFVCNFRCRYILRIMPFGIAFRKPNSCRPQVSNWVCVHSGPASPYSGGQPE